MIRFSSLIVIIVAAAMGMLLFIADGGIKTASAATTVPLPAITASVTTSGVTVSTSSAAATLATSTHATSTLPTARAVMGYTPAQSTVSTTTSANIYSRPTTPGPLTAVSLLGLAVVLAAVGAHLREIHTFSFEDLKYLVNSLDS